MFYAHINYIYENSSLTYKTIKSAFPLLRKKDGKLLSSLGTPEWLLGKLIFLIGYSLIVAGFVLVLYLDRAENDFFKYKLMVTVGGCWFFGFPLMFLSVPFYNASLVGKFIADQDGEEFNDDKLYKMVFARCKKRLIDPFFGFSHLTFNPFSKISSIKNLLSNKTLRGVCFASPFNLIFPVQNSINFSIIKYLQRSCLQVNYIPAKKE